MINKDSEMNIELVPLNKNPNLELYIDKNILKRFQRRQILFTLIFSNKLFWIVYYLLSKIFSPVVRYFFGNGRSFFAQVKKLNIRKIMIHGIKVPNS